MIYIHIHTQLAYYVHHPSHPHHPRRRYQIPNFQQRRSTPLEELDGSTSTVTVIFAISCRNVTFLHR